jgi:predicted GNAT family N-acyltransferase
MDRYRVTEPRPEQVATAQQAVSSAISGDTDPTAVVDAVGKRTDDPVTDGGVGTLTAVFAIRRAVFVGEQGVDPELEWDDTETAATHLLGAADGRAVGTARVRFVDDETAKAERLAVRRSDRHQGYGRRLMRAVETYATDSGATRCRVHAQRRVAEFYRSLGYRPIGDEFEEAGIPHVAMVIDLPTEQNE